MSVKVTEDKVDLFNESIEALRSSEVLVGIPSTNTTRRDGFANNAAIMAINEFGSPANNIPARPVFQIGIRNAEDEISDAFRRAAESIGDGKPDVERYLNRAGIVASNSIKKVINSQEGIDPPSPYTLRLRKEMGFQGEKALLVTGQLRGSITYLVVKK